MATRKVFSDDTLSALICMNPGWTRDIPMQVQVRLFPGITPAYEFGANGKGSGRGRGAPVLDLYRAEEIAPGLMDERIWGCKIYNAKRRVPTAPIVTTGKQEHVQTVIDAAERGTSIPMLVLCRIGDQWFQAVYDLGALIRRFGVQPAHKGRGKGRGQGHPVSMGESHVTYQPRIGPRKVYTYWNISVNISRAGIAWEQISSLANVDLNRFP